MNRNRVIAAIVVATGLLAAGGVARVSAQSEATPPPAEKSKPKPGLMGAPLANPWKHFGLRPENEILTGLVGKATTAVHVNEGPFPRAKDSTGTADAKPLMGGLFIEVTLSDTRMKEPYERKIIYGYDQVIGKYTAEVLDTTSPAIIRFIGTYDAAKKQLNLTSRYSDQNSRRYVVARLVTTFVDAKTWTYEDFVAEGPDKPEIQVAAVQMKRS
jgi:hypothetical protein